MLCSKALEYKVGRVLAPSVESICCGFQNDISDLLIKLLYCGLNKKNQFLKLIKYKIWTSTGDQNYCSKVVWTPERKILFVFDFIHFVLSNTVFKCVIFICQFWLVFWASIHGKQYSHVRSSSSWPKVLLKLFELIIAKTLRESATKKFRILKME